MVNEIIHRKNPFFKLTTSRTSKLSEMCINLFTKNSLLDLDGIDEDTY